MGIDILRNFISRTSSGNEKKDVAGRETPEQIADRQRLQEFVRLGKSCERFVTFGKEMDEADRERYEKDIDRRLDETIIKIGEVSRLDSRQKMELASAIQKIHDYAGSTSEAKGHAWFEKHFDALRVYCSPALSDGTLSFRPADPETGRPSEMKRYWELCDRTDLGEEEAAELRETIGKLDRFYKLTQLPDRWKKLDYEPFDPYIQLAGIRKGESDDRGDKSARRAEQQKNMLEYKKELLKQKRGIERIISQLEDDIQRDPDATYGQLTNPVYENASRYKLAPYQIVELESGIFRYVMKRLSVKDVSERFPDDRELFKACFGRYPNDATDGGPGVEAVRGKIGFYFLCRNLDDYIAIYCGKIYNDQKPTEQEIDQANRSGGVLINQCLLPELTRSVMVEKSIGQRMNLQVYIHEEQHLIHSLFSEPLPRGIKYDWFEDADPEDQEKMVAQALRTQRQWMENQIKDEILAYTIDGEEQRSVGDLLLRKRRDGGLYDYFDRWWRSGGHGLPVVMKGKGLDRERIEAAFDRVFSKEYARLIDDALGAVNYLKRRNMAPRSIIRLLETETLDQWPKIAKRISEVDSAEEMEASQRFKDKRRPEDIIDDWIDEKRKTAGNIDLKELEKVIERIHHEGRIGRERMEELKNHYL